MSWIAAAVIGSGALGAGASLIGSQEQAGAETQAANTIASSTQQAIGQETGFANQGVDTIKQLLSQGTGVLAPFVGAGSSALPTLQALLTPGTNMTQVLSQLPGFQFMQNWGQQGINNAATVSGLGGNVLKAGADYSSGLAQNAYSGIVGQLQNLVGMGSGAASMTGGLFSNAGSSIGNLLSGLGSSIAGLTSSAGQNIASTLVGKANAQAGGLTSAVSNIGGGLTNALLLNKLFPSGTTPWQPSTAPSGTGGIGSA